MPVENGRELPLQRLWTFLTLQRPAGGPRDTALPTLTTTTTTYQRGALL